LPGVIVSGLTEADIASQIPPGRADDPSRRQTALNVPIIRPMKKFLTTLTVIAATALGAQGQTTNTNTFPVGQGTNSFSGLTFGGTAADPLEDFTKARLYFRVEGFDFNGGDVNITAITLSGQGITSSLSFADVTITNNRTTFASATAFADFDTPVAIWNPAFNTTAFTAELRNGASALYGAQIFYRLRYSNFDDENIDRAGDVNLVAVPEPSTYAAAAGLLALFLWSSRRHLFKLAGARSSASGPDENGAA
jgi:hypothetical protein